MIIRPPTSQPRPKAPLRERLHDLDSSSATLVRRFGGWWAGLSLVAVLTLLFAAAALVGFVAIADEVLEGETLGVERGVLRWLASVRVGWLDEVAAQSIVRRRALPERRDRGMARRCGLDLVRHIATSPGAWVSTRCSRPSGAWTTRRIRVPALFGWSLVR